MPKTGTSYLQQSMRRSRHELARQGLDLIFPDGYDAMFTSLLLRDRLTPELDPPHAFSVLDRLAESAAKGRGDRALLSQEMLGGAVPERIPAFLEALSGYEVRVIVTIRDLAGFLPSAWQQVIKSRGTVTFPDFVDEFVTGRTAYRPASDIDYVLDTWGVHVPRERLHVVTVPKPGSDRGLLLDRFCTVLEVDPARLAAPPDSRNASLGAVQAELLRRVNSELGDRLPHRRAGYREQGKNFLAREILRPQAGARARMPKSLSRWCMEESERLIARISEQGYRVAGDLDELRPEPSAFADDDDDEFVSSEELLDASARALAAMLVERDERTRETRQLRRALNQSRRLLREQQQQPRLSAGGRRALRAFRRRLPRS